MDDTTSAPAEIVEWGKSRPLTRNEARAVSVLYDRCKVDDELREVMTSVRGGQPEWVIKHFFRDLKDNSKGL